MVVLRTDEASGWDFNLMVECYKGKTLPAPAAGGGCYKANTVYRPLDISPGCWVTAPTGCLDGKTDGKDALVAIFKTSDCYRAAWRYDPLDMKGQRCTRHNGHNYMGP